MRRKQFKPPNKKHHWLQRTTSAWQSKLQTARKNTDLGWKQNTNRRAAKNKRPRYKMSQEVEWGRLVPPGIEIGSAGHWHRSRRALRSVPGLLPRQFGSELHPRNISADQAQESLHDKPTVSLPRHAVRPGNYQRVDRAVACKSTSGHDYKWVAARLPALYLYSAFHSLPWPHPSYNNSTASINCGHGR